MALTYLFLTTFKNRIKEIIKNPVRLIFTIFFILFIIGFIIIGLVVPKQDTERVIRNIHELYLIVFGFYSLMYIMFCFRGLSQGATFFSMADVNVLFNTPIKPRTILNYGLIKQMGTSLLMGVFLVFQYYWMSQNYDISMADLLFIILGYSVMVFLGQLSSMAIYSFSSQSETRRKIIKYIIYAILLLIIGYIAFVIFTNSNNYDVIMETLTSPWLFFMPVTGWLTVFIIGVFEGNILLLLLGLGANLLFTTIIIILIAHFDTDFYEDVLKSTETMHSAITARKEGKAIEAIPTNIKLGKVGINRGNRASVFYYKHLKESRRAKVFIFDMITFIVMIVSIVFAFLMSNGGLTASFAFSIYMAFFAISQGRWVKELNLPYVYMIPEKSFVKLIMIILENIRKIVIISIIQFGVIYFLVNPPILDIIASALGYIAFNILFIAVIILSERLLGNINNKGLIITLYIVFIILLALPGIIGGAIIGALYPSLTYFISIMILTGWNILVSLIIMFLCRHILEYAELNNR